MAATNRWGAYFLFVLAGACGSAASDGLTTKATGGSAGSQALPAGGAGNAAGATQPAGSGGEVAAGNGGNNAGSGGALPAGGVGSGGTDPAGGSGNAGNTANSAGGGTGGTGGNAGNTGNTAGDGNTGNTGNAGGDSAGSAGSAGAGSEEPTFPGPELPPEDPGEDLTACNGEGMLGHPLPDFDYPEYEGFTLCLVEEFEEAIDIHGDDPIWTYSDGSLFEGNVRHVPDALSFQDGKLVITVSEETTPVSWSWSAHSYIPEKPLQSGELRTKFNNFRYGRYEVRMRAPDVVGNFIATMFTFRTPGFQDWREIDVELLGSRPNTFLSNLIYADNQELWSADIEEPAYDYPFALAPDALPAGYHRSAFHTYSFEWTPHQIRWFVDGKHIRTKQGGIGEDQLPVPELPSKIFMNLWVFPNADFGGNPALNEYPFSSEYEWFRFYKWNGEVTYPCSGAPSCLDETDLDYSKNNDEDGVTPSP